MRIPGRVLDFLENRIGWPPAEFWTGPLDAFHGTHFVLPPTRRARTILTVHDVSYLRAPGLYSDTRGNDYGYRHLLKRSLRRADRVIAISDSTRLIEKSSGSPGRSFLIFRISPITSYS